MDTSKSSPYASWLLYLSWILRACIIAGLIELCRYTPPPLPQPFPQPTLLCIEPQVPLPFVRQTLESFSFSPEKLFCFISPSPHDLPSPLYSWKNFPWDKTPSPSPSPNPSPNPSQEFFLFLNSPPDPPLHPEIEKHFPHFFLFYPPPDPPQTPPTSLPSAVPELFLEIQRIDQSIHVSCKGKALQAPVELYLDKTLLHTWPLSEEGEFSPPPSKLPPLSPGNHLLWLKSGKTLCSQSIHQQAPLRILSLSSFQENALLETLLKAQKLDVTVQEKIPENLFHYHVVLLQGASAQKLSRAESLILQKFVRDAGGALLFLQGEPDTLPPYFAEWMPLQHILPPPKATTTAPPTPTTPTPPPVLEKDEQTGQIRGEKEVEKTSLSLVLILDRSGSMSGSKLQLAKESALACLGQLQDDDTLGVLSFNQKPTWTLLPTPAWKKSKIHQALQSLKAEGDTLIYPALEAAYEELKGQGTSVKHLILLSDGYSSIRVANYRQIAEKMVKAGMTLSTIGIGDEFDHTLMSNLSEWGKGRFYFTSDFKRIAYYVTKDTETVLREIRPPELPPSEKPQNPEKKPKIEPPPPKPEELPPPPVPASVYPVHGEGPLFRTLQAPSVERYRRATPLSGTILYATVEQEPWLALRRFGLGKILHGLGKLDETWSPQWLAWKDLAPFWSQAVQHIALEKPVKKPLRYQQESTETRSQLQVYFPFFLDSESQYRLEGEELPSPLSFSFDSPTTLSVQFPFPGTQYYRWNITQWKDEKLQESYPLDLLVYPTPPPVEQQLPKHSSPKSTSAIPKVRSPSPDSPLFYKQQEISYFSPILAGILFLLLVEIALRQTQQR
jgi:hypothetical protein